MRRLVGLALLTGVAGAALYTLHLDRTIRTRFEGKRWALAARVYGRALELYRGAEVSARDFARELEALRYRPDAALRHPGTYTRRANAFRLKTRPFVFWDGEDRSRELRVTFAGDSLGELLDGKTGRDPGVVRLDPPLIGSIYPKHREDRILVHLSELPPFLPEALIAVEDQSFYEHSGVDFRAIGRALLANLRARGVVQGGSTLTQQLVKNYFLSSERTLWRKANEAVMALLLEIRYGKDEILEAYLNEIYLGQQTARAIHGVGLASHFYFDRPASELSLPEVALLVALIRGPSYYDPRRHPERARQRRDLVLQLLAERDVVSQAEARAAEQSPLGVTPTAPEGTTRYPAFVDLVQRQLQRDYREEDLRSEGLRIFTTLDPLVQGAAEGALAKRSELLELERGFEAGTLEGAAVVTHTETGEVQALVGGRNARFAGFNRALDAARPVGSLIKPSVYLTALETPERYTLATLLDDFPVEIDSPGSTTWSPENFDRQVHGRVTLYESLVHSYNLSTVRLGLALGVPRVLDTLQRLGLERRPAPYPSVLLGAVDLSPFEVAQIYQTLASGGFRTPLRAIREVVAADGQPLQRYPLTVEQSVAPESAYLVNFALRGVVLEGTAETLGGQIPSDLAVAGKTGTTDGLRDSWFAGFTGDWLAVVWLGRDDNQPTGLTGSSGALRVWAELAQQVSARPFSPVAPGRIEYAWVDRETGLGSWESEGAVRLPFLEGSAPPQPHSVLPQSQGAVVKGKSGLWRRLKGWFQRSPE